MREREGENCERHNFAVHSSKISLVLVSSPAAAAATAAFAAAAIYAVRLCMCSRDSFSLQGFVSECDACSWKRVENLAERNKAGKWEK